MYKRHLQWASIGQRERFGILGLLLVLVVAVGVRAYMIAGYNSATPKVILKHPCKHEKRDGSPTVININTADSEALCGLRGVGGKTAHKLLQARRKKRFTHAYEVLEYLRIKERDWKELRERIRFR